jgi:hypothetical protein
MSLQVQLGSGAMVVPLLLLTSMSLLAWQMLG